MVTLRSLDHFPLLNLWQLKYWAFLTGEVSSGNKAELLESLVRSLNIIIPNAGRRVVSVDMGIRNLAYCVVDTPLHSSTRSAVAAKPLRITSWTRRDLLSTAAPEINSLQQHPPSKAHGGVGADVKKKKCQPNTEAFTPAQLSKTAHSLDQDLLSHEPDDILIERQRFRSGGASAILEWTVRVNMLESMLWASLETLRASGPRKQSFPNIHAVEPKRVATFWLSGQLVPLITPVDFFERGHRIAGSIAARTKPRIPRAQIEKKEKVDLVKKWVSAAGAIEDTNMQLAFEGQAAEVAEAFRSESLKGAKKIAGGKLDDLADCLLQAVAHLSWEDNKRAFREKLLEP